MSNMASPPTVLDYDAPGNRRKLLLVLQSIFVALTGLIVAVRFYSRAILVRSVGTDDWLILLAYCLAIGVVVSCGIATDYGWTFHVGDVPVSEGIIATAWAFQLVFSAAVSIVKLSILFFYLRLDPPVVYRRVIWGGIIFVLMWLISFEIAISLLCFSPTNPVIGPNFERSPRCVPKDPTVAIHGITNIITDFFVLILPMPMLWSLSMPRKRKIGLILLFSGGGLVCICGMVRLVYSLTTQSNVDYTYISYDLWIWAVLEIDLGIICASAPSLKAVVAMLFPRLFDTRLPARTRPTGSGYSKKLSSNDVITPGALASKKWNGSGQVLPSNNTKTNVRAGDSQERIVESGIGKNMSITRTVEFRHASSIELDDRGS